MKFSDLLTVVVVGYDVDSDIWPISNFLFEKNWNNCPFKSVFVSVNKRNENSPYSENLITNGKENFSDRLIVALQKVETPYVLLLIHDYGLISQANYSELLSCCDFMKEGAYKYCQVGNQYGLPISYGKKSKNPLFFDLKRKKTYRINLQPAIWDKEFLTEIAHSTDLNSAFDVEILLNDKNYDFKNAPACFPKNLCVSYIDILEKGVLSFEVLQCLAELNQSQIKVTRKIQTQSDFEKKKKRMAIYLKTPVFLVKIINFLKGKKSFINRRITNKKPTVIISGANGFLGLLLVKKFYENGYNVQSLLQIGNNDNLEEAEKYSTRITRTNFDDDSFKKYLYKNPDAFIHLAWAGVNGSSKGDEGVQNNNVKMALNASSAAVYCKAKRFIGMGTVTELSYLNKKSEVLSPSLVYGKYKNQCFEELKVYFKDKETKLLWLRLSNLYGISNRTGNILNYEISTILNGQVPSFGPSNQYYDFLLADDAIEAIYRFSRVTSFSNSVYFVGSNKPNVLSYYLNYVAQEMGNSRIEIGARPDDGMVFLKDFFKSDETFKTIGNYVSDAFENNMKKLIKALKEGEK